MDPIRLAAQQHLALRHQRGSGPVRVLHQHSVPAHQKSPQVGEARPHPHQQQHGQKDKKEIK
jgi:hypothetical protein